MENYACQIAQDWESRKEHSDKATRGRDATGPSSARNEFICDECDASYADVRRLYAYGAPGDFHRMRDDVLLRGYHPVVLYD